MKTTKKNHSNTFSCQPQPHFKRKFDWLAEHLTENTERQRTNHIFCASETQNQRYPGQSKKNTQCNKTHLIKIAYLKTIFI